MPSVIQRNQDLFQSALAKIAYKKAYSQTNCYDFRGRMIFNLKLKEDDFKEIVENMGLLHQFFSESKDGENNALKQIEQAIGIKITNPIRCHLDFSSKMQCEFKEQLLFWRNQFSHIQQMSPQTQASRMSIIPIYEELLCNLEHHHACVQKQLNHLKTPKISYALQVAFNESKEAIQKLITKLRFEKPISELSVLEINQLLDKARKVCHYQLKMLWFNTFKLRITKIPKSQKIKIFKALLTEQFKELYKETPSHQYSVFGTDFVNETATFITSAEELTSHNKEKWHTVDKPGASASRFIIRSPLSLNLNVSMKIDDQLSMRIPSIAVVSRKVEEDILIIQQIFTQIHHDFDQASELNNEPIIYNLLTSLNGAVAEFLDGNHQKESTRRILQGAHLYNKSVKNSGKFIWVQNLAVNRHSDNLGGLFSFLSSSVHKEVTLMADISLLYTLQYNLPETHPCKENLKKNYNEVLIKYKQFLQTPNPKDLYKSSQGKEIANLIHHCKQSLQLPSNLIDEDISTLATKALLKIFKYNTHYQEKFGTLIQTLSVATVKKTMVGCKSSNERHEDIQKRVGVFIGIGGKKILPIELKQAFFNFLNGLDTASSLSNAISSVTNILRMYGDETSISHSDQPASSKYQNMAGPFKRFLWKVGLWLANIGIPAALGLVIWHAIGVACPAIGIPFWLVGGIITALGLLLMVMGKKAPNTNNGCDPLCTNNINQHAKSMQAEEGIKCILEASKKELSLLCPSPFHWKAATWLFVLSGLHSVCLNLGLVLFTLFGLTFPPAIFSVLIISLGITTVGLASMGISYLITKCTNTEEELPLKSASFAGLGHSIKVPELVLSNEFSSEDIFNYRKTFVYSIEQNPEQESEQNILVFS